MTKESEVEKTAKFARHLLQGIIVLIVVIVLVVGAVVGVSMYWAWHQQQEAKNIVTSLFPTPYYNSIPTPIPSYFSFATPTPTPTPTPSLTLGGVNYRDAGDGMVDISGHVYIDTNGNFLYSATYTVTLHIVGVFSNGVTALDTNYRFTANGGYFTDFDTGILNYQAGLGFPNWTMTSTVTQNS